MDPRDPSLLEERVVNWPSWPDPRPLCHEDVHFHDLTRTKPLKKEAIVGIYSAQAVKMVAKGNETDLFAKIFERPPLHFDLTWTRREKKRGFKVPEEAWPETAQHVAKAGLPLTQIFVKASDTAASSGTVREPEVFRFDYAEQAVKHQLRSRKMHSHLSGLTWNAGSSRQGLDISCFVAGTWSYIMLQEASPLALDRLESMGYNVISVAESALAVAMPRDFLRAPGQLVQVVDLNLESGQWALRAMFARFDLDVPQDWPTRSLVVGSCHLNNWVAREKRGLTRQFLQQLFTAAHECGCDILGTDLNQGINQLSEQFQLWIQKHNLEPVPTTLLGHRDGDCCGFLVFPGSRLLSLSLQRHGSIAFDHRDLEIRQYDADSHHPSFVFHSATNKRSRGPMSDKRLERQDRKKAKLEEKRANRGR